LRDEVWLEIKREGISMSYLLYYNYKKETKSDIIRRGRQTSQSIIIPFIPPHFDLKYLFYNYTMNLVVIWEFKIMGDVSLCFNNMLFKGLFGSEKQHLVICQRDSSLKNSRSIINKNALFVSKTQGSLFWFKSDVLIINRNKYWSNITFKLKVAMF
jgi:hypothetical protein